MRRTIATMMAGICVLAMVSVAAGAPSAEGEGQATKSAHRHTGRHHKSAGKATKPRHTRHAHKHATAS